jgi:LPXTG-motif cell wall-anchored protein
MGATSDGLFRRAVLRLAPISALLIAAVVISPAGRVAAADNKPPGDPPGNNGTIKVAASDPSDPHPGNEPHVDGCLVWLEFYGFDQNQTADISFTAQPPSGTKQLIAQKDVPISATPAGGGQDKDVVLSYNLTSAVQGLKAQPKQGYHIKVRSDTKQAPGGYKQKVFWIKCTPAPAGALRITKAVTGAGAGPFGFSLRCNHRLLDTTFTLDAGQTHDVANVPAGTVCVAAETDSKGATTKISESPPDGPADGRVKLRGRMETITFTNVFPAARAAAEARAASSSTPPAATQPATVAGASAARTAAGAAAGPATAPQAAATLPRTGEDSAALATLGLWALSTGTLLGAVLRRRRES